MSVFDRTIVSCPYNPEHKVRRPRLLWHLAAGCPDEKEKAHLFHICPYNCLHIILKEEFEAHKVDCPDGKLLKIFNYEPNDIWMTDLPKFRPEDTWEGWDNPVKDSDKMLSEVTAEIKIETDWDLSTYLQEIRITESATNDSSPNLDSENEKKDLEVEKIVMEEEVIKESTKDFASYEEKEKMVMEEVVLERVVVKETTNGLESYGEEKKLDIVPE